MKSIISCWVWACYCIVSLIYFAGFGLIEPMYSKLSYLGSTIVVLVFSIVRILSAPTGYVLAFTACSLSAISLNILFILLYHLTGINNYKFNFCIFIGVEFITALFIFISGIKRGLFNNE